MKTSQLSKVKSKDNIKEQIKSKKPKKTRTTKKSNLKESGKKEAGYKNRVKSGRIEKAKFKKKLKKENKQNIKSKGKVKSKFLNKKKKPINQHEQTVPTKNQSENFVDSQAEPKVKKNKQMTHQLLFFRKLKKKSKTKDLKNSDTNAEEKQVFKNLSRKERNSLPLHKRMMEKLLSARFRYLNEQMYTNKGQDAKEFFESDPTAYQAYHEGYRQQVDRWPINPLDVIIKKIKKLPRSFIIADFGCGEAKLAKSVPHVVHSFDLVAVNETVTACDMAKVPLDNSSVNVVVFCLSLMGTNLKDYLVEANRVLVDGGLLKIAEVESRFEDVNKFVMVLQNYGFSKVKQDLSHELFWFFEGTKTEGIFKKINKLPEISLQPCLYKKR